jgi:hypothetical protein
MRAVGDFGASNKGRLAKLNRGDSNPVVMAGFIECRDEDALFVDEFGRTLDHITTPKAG